jgi:hypothetical protein
VAVRRESEGIMRHVPRRLAAILSVAGLTVATVAVAASATVSAPAGADRIVVATSGTASFAGKGSTGTIPTGPTREWRGPKRTGSSPLQSNQLSDGPELKSGSGGSVTGRPRAKSNPQLLMDFEGINHLQQRVADSGNQFSGEPPDQGLCVGNGYIMETVNSAVRVYNDAGAPLTPVLSLNEFYGFPSAFTRPAGPFGPFTFDISCHYDPDSDRWFHLAVDLDQDPATGDFTGKNYLDLAVSTSSDPTGSWTVYRIPGINDGSEGTPDHDCDGGPCFADFPHLGMDKYGLYITTNEFPLFADGFIGAQIYAISKKQLVAGAPSISVFLFNTADDPVRPGEPGFTVWPALSPAKQFAGEGGGTEYFVSSNAVFDDANADSEELILWALVHTKELDTPSPNLALHKTILDVNRYAVPSNSVQKSGPAPLRECLNDTALSFFGIANCGLALVGLPPQNLPIGTIDSGDSRVLDVRYANRKLWAVLGTAAQVDGVDRTAVGWYIINPSASKDGVSGSVLREGILASQGESIVYPTIGVTTSGRGVIAFSQVGENTFPSIGYAAIDDRVGAGTEIHQIEAGKSPQDGFTEYPPVGGNRPRWGDYSASAVNGNFVYVASEYIEQGPCTLNEYITGGFTCGDTRSSLANWSTRVAKLKP